MRIPIAGLWTNPNDFDAPAGSCEVLTNMTQERPGIWEPRRGFTLLEGTPTITGPINAIASFRGSIIVHHNTTSISRWTGSAWSTYSGTFTPPTSSASGRVHFAVMNQSLFVTTTLGIYELDSPTGTWRLTGNPKALDGTATLRRTVNETGFATSGGQWAYRDEWGIKNANNRLQIGPPSGRIIVQSPAAVVTTAANISKTAGTAVVTVINTTHGFATGEYVDVTLGGAETHFTAGTFQVTVGSSTSFTYNDGGDAAFSGNPGNNITYGFTSGRGVTRVVPIPSGITTDNFVQSYRSVKSASATSEPSDSMGQVYERSPTNLEIAAGSMTFTDITPDDFRGALLDVSGETILAAKYRPPVSADLALFHNSAFYAETKTQQVLNFQIIAVGGTAGIQSGDLLYFGRYTDPVLDAFTIEAGSSETTNTFKLYTTGSVAQNISDTARSIVRTINTLTPANTTLYAEYTSGDFDPPGMVRVYARTPLIEAFSIFTFGASGATTAGAFVDQLPVIVTITNIARSGSTVTVNTAQPHSLASGQTVRLIASSNTSHFPNGVKTATVVDADTFTYTEAGSAVVAEANTGYFLARPLETTQSTNVDRTDRVVFSLPDQPWAVPLPNEMFIEGTPTTTSSAPTAFRLISNRDQIYLWADSGLFRVTGFYPDFTIGTIQTPLKLLAPEAAVTQGTPGNAYGVTDTGTVSVMTSPVSVSTPIQDVFQVLQLSAPAALKNYAFAVAYPSAFKVLFFLPESSTDTKATNAYVLHTRTGEWSRWDVDGTAGMVDPVTDKLYIGQADGAVWVERKTGTVYDYWDPKASADGFYTYSSVGASTIGVDVTTAGLAVGDIIRDSNTSTAAFITAINGLTVTLSSLTGFSAPGVFGVEHAAYTKTVQPTRWFGKEGPTIDKDVGSGLLFVDPPDTSAEFTTLGLSFRNDYDPSFSSAETLTLNSVMTSQLPFNVPDHMQRCGWLQPKVTHANGGERFRALGYGFNYAVAGPKSP